MARAVAIPANDGEPRRFIRFPRGQDAYALNLTACPGDPSVMLLLPW